MRIDSAIITGSFSVNGDTFNDLGSYSTTGSNIFVDDQIISGAVYVNGDGVYVRGTNSKEIYITSNDDSTYFIMEAYHTSSYIPDRASSEKYLDGYVTYDKVYFQGDNGAYMDYGFTAYPNKVDVYPQYRGAVELWLPTTNTTGSFSVRNWYNLSNNFLVNFLSNGRTLFNNATDNFINTLQVSGSIYANSLTGSILATNGVVSGSSQIDIVSTTGYSTFSSSNASIESTQNTRLNSLENKTGSLATTGSNTFIGTQTITGSLFISSDLIVQGSSSLQNITASAVSIGTNIVSLNTANPAIRYAGLVIGDSGSVGGSGSFLYDSLQDEMIFVHRGTSNVVTSSVVLMGPQTFDTVGTEIYPTSNFIQKGTGNEHLADSCIIDNGTTTCIKNNLVGTGTACFTGAVCSNYLYSATSIVAGGTLWTGDTIRKLSDNQCIFFRNAAGTVEATISGDGAATFTRRVTAQNISVISDSSEQITVTTASDSNKQLIFGRTATEARIIAVTQNVGYVPLSLQPNGGNIGIGCLTPSYLLDVNGTGRFLSGLHIQAANNSGLPFINFSNNGGAFDWGRVGGLLQGDGDGALYFQTKIGGGLTEKLRINSSGVACFSNTICAPIATIQCLGINSAWSSSGGAYQTLQVKSGLGNSGIWVESCSSDAGAYINMAGNCVAIGQSYRSSGGYNDILFQTAGSTRMVVRCAGNVEVQTGIISPMFMIERNSPWDDITTGQYLSMNDAGTLGLNAKFQQQFAPFVNYGEGMTWNSARMIIRITTNTGTFSQSLAGCIRNASYFYGNGWQCFGAHVPLSTVMDSGRGFRWIVMPWFTYSDFYGTTDVPGLGLYNQFSDIALRIGAVYLQYKA
jgi:hypothetical protein